MKKYSCIVVVSVAMMFSCRSNVSDANNNPPAGAGLVSASQSRCVSSLKKESETISNKSFNRVDSLDIGRDYASITIIQWGYCSSRFKLSASDSLGTITLYALDTTAMIAQCGCPFRLSFSLKDAGIENKKIIYIGSVHSEINSDCTLVIKE